MGWMSPDKVAALLLERRVQKQWQQRNVSQGRRGAKENRVQIEKRTLVQTKSVIEMPEEVAVRLNRTGFPQKDTTMNNILLPGIAVVYRSTFRYAQAHEDMLTIDMFDATIEPVKDVVVSADTVPAMKHGPRPFETLTLLPDEIPHALQGKLAALEIVRSSLCTTPGMRAQVPGIGLVFGTGVKWVILTKEDCDGC